MHTFVVLAYKESEYLEDCIKSVIHQKYRSKVVIATSTPNAYIKNLADKYNITLIKHDSIEKGIGYDFDFALNCVDDTLITIAHQDDIYDYEYSWNIIDKYEKNKDSLIIFSDYYEIRGREKVESNKNFLVKRLLLMPLRINIISKTYFIKRFILRFGNPICCPAVTFVKRNLENTHIFKSHMKCNVDWLAWERLSIQNGKFVYINKLLMGHRVHSKSTTTDIINHGIRTEEDIIMFKKFWPTWIAEIINKFYKKSEESNKN